MPVTVTIGSTEARMWWMLGLPAVVFGTSCFNIAQPDEYIPAEDFGRVLKVHLGTVIDMLCGGGDDAVDVGASL